MQWLHIRIPFPFVGKVVHFNNTKVSFTMQICTNTSVCKGSVWKIKVEEFSLCLSSPPLYRTGPAQGFFLLKGRFSCHCCLFRAQAWYKNSYSCIFDMEGHGGFPLCLLPELMGWLAHVTGVMVGWEVSWWRIAERWRGMWEQDGLWLRDEEGMEYVLKMLQIGANKTFLKLKWQWIHHKTF